MADNVVKETYEEMLQRAKIYDYIRFTFADIHGRPCTRVVPRKSLDRMFTDGLGLFIGATFLGAGGEVHVDPKKLPTLTTVECGNDVALFPQPGTLTPVPWQLKQSRPKVGQVLCEYQWLSTRLPLEECPRYMARKQLVRLEELGYHMFSGFEIEFMLLNGATRKPVFDNMQHFVKNDTWNKYEDLILDIDQALQDMNVDLEAHQVEYGNGQFETATAPALGVQAADNVFLFKDAAREIVNQRGDGLEAIFMTKPDEKCNGNGLHFNHSLLDRKGVNILHDKDDELKLSAVARHWIGGLTKHAGALTALVSPTLNCYRRLHLPWAPHNGSWGVEDRNTAFRVRTQCPKKTFIEFRMPSGSVNPYLALAAIVAAGVDGIVNKIECPPQRDPEAVVLPKSLPKALELLEADDVLREALGKEFVTYFTILKTEYELKVLTDFDKEKPVEDQEWELYKRL